MRVTSTAQFRHLRSRCLGHIVNLAAKAFLLGDDYDAFMDDVAVAEQATLRDEQLLAQEQAKWRSRGPIGKFHNIVVYIRRSPQRRQEFKAEIEGCIRRIEARGETPDFTTDLTVILDNSTRWNSTYRSIRRGLRLREPIDSYLLHHNGPLNDDKLTDEDWAQLAEIAEALEPFDHITLRLEGDGKSGTHGAIWEAITSLDYLLTNIERRQRVLREQQEAQQQQRQEAQQQETGRRRGRTSRRSTTPPTTQVNPLLIAYQNAWQKLTEYNALTDENHEIYAAGALLSPCLRRAYFEKR
ncbi:hypothetical protein ABEF95_004870 [Exophiala dermatitidis]